MILPLRNSILFCFFDKTDSLGKFEGSTDWGFDLGTNTDDTTKRGRWGKVVSIGPDVIDVSVDDNIFISPLMWTVGFSHNGIRVWKTDETNVLAISPDAPKR